MSNGNNQRNHQINQTEINDVTLMQRLETLENKLQSMNSNELNPSQKPSDNNDRFSNVQCFSCRNFGHIKRDCPEKGSAYRPNAYPTIPTQGRSPNYRFSDKNQGQPRSLNYNGPAL